MRGTVIDVNTNSKQIGCYNNSFAQMVADGPVAREPMARSSRCQSTSKTRTNLGENEPYQNDADIM